MKKIEQATRNFLSVKDTLLARKEILAHNLAWRKPKKYFLERSPAEAIELLIEEAKNTPT